MKMFDSTDKKYQGQPYRMSFKDGKLKVSRWRKTNTYTCKPLDDSEQFLRDAIFDFLLFNPRQLKVVEETMCNCLKKLSEELEKPQWTVFQEFLEYMELTRREMVDKCLAKFSENYLVNAGFDYTTTNRIYEVPNTGLAVDEVCSRDNRYQSEYSISIDKNGEIVVERNNRAVFSTRPNLEKGEILLGQSVFQEAVALCLRMDPAKFYKIADELKKFVKFNKDGKVTAVSEYYFYLNFMSSEEYALKMEGKWSTCTWL